MNLVTTNLLALFSKPARILRDATYRLLLRTSGGMLALVVRSCVAASGTIRAHRFTFILLLSLTPINAQIPNNINIAGFNIKPEDMARMMVTSVEAVEQAAQQSRKKKELAIQTLEHQLIDLGKKKDRGVVGANEYEQMHTVLTRKLTHLRNELETLDKSAQTVGANVQNVLLSGWNTLMENYTEELRRKTQIAVAAASKAVENEGRLAQAQLEVQTSMERLRFMSDPTNLKNYAIFLGLGAVGIAGGYYGTKLAYNYLEKRLERRPAAVSETSYQGFWDRSVNALYTFLGYEQEQISLADNIVFAPEIEEQLQTVAKITRMTHDKGLPHQALLLHGPPGTGKTWFATLLAKTADMDYVITSADRFAQFTEGSDIHELHALLDWSEQCPRGMIIFIDEIDALGANRNELADRWVRLQNAFLSRTGKSCAEFKIIGATNRLNALDPAFLNRFPQQIFIPLPGIPERERLFNLYIKKYIVDDVRTIKQDGQMIQAQLQLSPDIDATFIQALALKTDGLAGREIEQAVDLMRAHSYLSDDLVLTKNIAEAVVTAKMKEKAAVTAA